MNVNDFLERIAPSEKDMLESLFNPVSFSDGSKGTYSGFIRPCRGHRVDFNYAGKEYSITGNAGWVARSIFNGKNWYSYTLDPSNGLLSFSQESAFAKLMLARYGRARA